MGVGGHRYVWEAAQRLAQATIDGNMRCLSAWKGIQLYENNVM